MINQRMQEIMEAYSVLREFDMYDLEMESVGNKGEVKVRLTKPKVTFERIISPTESLDWIPDTFNYPNTITPRSRDIAPEFVKMAYFGQYGDLMVEHLDGSIEEFRVNHKQLDAVVDKLSLSLGKKLKVLKKREPSNNPNFL